MKNGEDEDKEDTNDEESGTPTISGNNPQESGTPSRTIHTSSRVLQPPGGATTTQLW